MTAQISWSGALLFGGSLNKTPITRVCLGASGNSRIRTLNLSGNNIGDKGAALLAEMLKARALG